MTRRLAALLLAGVVLAHGEHGHGHDDDPTRGYAERHMAAEHHIDSFDLPSFFKLHDLDLDGVWDRDEIAALYGLRHHSVLGEEKKNAGLEDRIVSAVLAKLDTNGDGKISLEEYVAGGKDSLPVIGDFKDLGHHYDEESEYFLHHEELYHSTPETQTDESYTHPEDIEHFKHHDHIEAEEDARERIFLGLEPDADLDEDHAAPPDPLAEHAHAPGEGPQGAAGHEGAGAPPLEGEEPAEKARAERAARRTPPNRLQDEAPQGAGGRFRHNTEERGKKDAPYKYRMRPGLRSDEF